MVDTKVSKLPSCATCVHRAENPDHCRRFPPTVQADGSAGFPVVNPTSWFCGEYKRAAKSKQQ